MTKVNRNYSMTDAVMLETAKIKHQFFVNDMIRFGAFDPDFNARWSQDWLDAIKEAELSIKDVSVVGEQAQQTEKVLAVLDRCAAKVREVRFFVKKAFPGNQTVLREFGLHHFNAVRNAQAQMIQLMQIIHGRSLKYDNELGEVNYTAAHIDEIRLLKEELNAANHAQEMFKGSRPALTQERIKLLNKVWTCTRQACEAGKIIFAGDKARHDRFLLPAGSSASEEEEDIEEAGEIGEFGETGEV